MKLIYQWLIIIGLVGLLWLVHIQAGGKLSRLLCFKEPTSRASITQNIIIKTRRYSHEVAKDVVADQVKEPSKGLPQTIDPSTAVKSDKSEKEESKKDDVPKVPTTPPSKTASQKRKARRKAIKVIIRSEPVSPRSEWDWCDREPKMIQ
ncbi:MAG: hypothetical protein ACHQVS_00500 [Candidatus Babeliales bacterium]